MRITNVWAPPPAGRRSALRRLAARHHSTSRSCAHDSPRLRSWRNRGTSLSPRRSGAAIRTGFLVCWCASRPVRASRCDSLHHAKDQVPDCETTKAHGERADVIDRTADAGIRRCGAANGLPGVTERNHSPQGSRKVRPPALCGFLNLWSRNEHTPASAESRHGRVINLSFPAEPVESARLMGGADRYGARDLSS